MNKDSPDKMKVKGFKKSLNLEPVTYFQVFSVEDNFINKQSNVIRSSAVLMKSMVS